MWLHGNTFVPPVDVFWSYRVTVSARMAAGPLLWLVRNYPGQFARPRCYHRQLQALVENVFIFSANSALDVLRTYDDALYKFFSFYFTLLYSVLTVVTYRKLFYNYGYHDDAFQGRCASRGRRCA